MKLSSQIKPVSYLKAHAADVIRRPREEKQPMIITRNGKARIVVQDIESYERTRRLWRCSRSWRWATAKLNRARPLPRDWR